jgi:hypothetical protein
MNAREFLFLAIATLVALSCLTWATVSSPADPRVPEVGDSQLIVKSTETRSNNLCIYIIGQDKQDGKITSKFAIQSRCGVYTPGDRIVITKSIVPRTERIGGKKK